MTVTEAQGAPGAVAFGLVRLEERCQELLDSLPRPDNEAAMFEGRFRWDLPTELLTTIEFVREELRSVAESLERVSRVRKDDMRREQEPRR